MYFQRREALKCLISTAQATDPTLKKIVTEKVKDFFVDFPDLQDEAINAIYDLCEDQDQSVRISVSCDLPQVQIHFNVQGSNLGLWRHHICIKSCKALVTAECGRSCSTASERCVCILRASFSVETQYQLTQMMNAKWLL